MNVPTAVGVPLIVMVLEDQVAVTPTGRPVAVPIPVATAVVCVMGVRGLFIHTVGMEEATEAVFPGVTVMVPVASTVPQPPVRGIL